MLSSCNYLISSTLKHILLLASIFLTRVPAALKITGVQRSNNAENRSLNAQDGVTPVTLNTMIFD